MKTIYWSILLSIIIVSISCSDESRSKDVVMPSEGSNYLQNRAPLKPRPYMKLPLGTIKADGWLKEQLERMVSGMTGNLDTIYPQVLGERNGWLGGDGDGWERGPYWIDGLLPLAYILDDELLKSKARPWIEWTLTHQTTDGYIGPVPFDKEPENEPGLQRGARKDWWPKMIMAKVLQQHYNATGDPRVITVLTDYFKYQLKELPERPLDYLRFWANRRGADNLQVVYWLYNVTGDKFLLELGDIIHEQTFPWTQVFLNDADSVDPVEPYRFFQTKGYPFDSIEIQNTSVSQVGGIHTVNLAQGLKQPIIRYQKDADSTFIFAAKKALREIKKYHGQPQGMYGGDEPLHGTDPTRGIEFCSISEAMFSLESMIKITGDMQFADLLERITYNALPTQASDDFSSRQYFQAANQVELSDRLETSYEAENHKNTDFVFGTLTGYTCCTTNMHQSWPKFVQNLFYATDDKGVAVLQYAPSSVNMRVADNVELRIEETTGYPFSETVHFEMGLPRPTVFPFHLRIPDWATDLKITVNGKPVVVASKNGIAIINREWHDGDQVKLTLPMALKASRWHANSSVIERGPLVYSLGIKGDYRKKNRADGYGEFTEVYPTQAWNFGLLSSELDGLAETVKIVKQEWDGSYPWNLDNAPIKLKVRGVPIPQWQLVQGAPVFPDLSENQDGLLDKESEEITLVPYGCTTLRITEFPVIE